MAHINPHSAAWTFSTIFSILIFTFVRYPWSDSKIFRLLYHLFPVASTISSPSKMHLIRLVAFVVLFIYSSASPISYPIPKARKSTSSVEPSHSNASPLVLRNLQAATPHDTSTEELLKKQQSSSSVASEPTASSHAPAGTIVPLSSVPTASTPGASSQPAATTPDSTPTAEKSSAQHTSSSTSRAVGTVVPITDAFPHSTTENHEASSSPASVSMPVVVVVGASSTETDSSLLATTSSSNTQINSSPSPAANSINDSIPSTEFLITTITHTEPCSTTSAPPPSSTEEKRMFSINYSSTSTETLNDPVITPAAEFSPDSSGLSMEKKRMFSINYSSTSTEDLDSFFITRADSSSSETTPTPTTVVVTASHTGSRSSSSAPSRSSFTPDVMFPLIQLWWEATDATVSPSVSASASATSN